MKISCLPSQWNYISREERYFCHELFNSMNKSIDNFFQIINEKIPDRFDLGYEVCFYRDILDFYKIPKKKSKYSLKRTFDLAIFTKSKIYILEAKTSERFEKKQLDSIYSDSTNIKKIYSEILKYPCPELVFIAIIPEGYNPSIKTMFFFDHKITWKQLAIAYPESKNIFFRANTLKNDYAGDKTI